MPDKGTVLIIEDEPLYCKLYKEVLPKGEYNIEVAMDLKIADVQLRRLRPDVLILDLRFPPNYDPKEGLEFLKRIRDFDSTIKIIIVTGASDRDIDLQSIQFGAYDFVRKEADFETELPFRVKQAYDKLQLERKIQEAHKLEVERIGGYPYGDGKIIIGTSAPMRAVYDLIDNIAPTDIPVFIEGETGTGKELVAEAIYAKSKRANNRYIRKSILDIPREGNLLELELFGRVANYPHRGDAALPGLFEKAQGGTLFLDEIAGVLFDVQGRFLRALREKMVVRMGDPAEREISVDYRLIAATNKNLIEEVQAGRFRPDLYERLTSGEVIQLPPLRDRKSDIHILAKYFIHRQSLEHDRRLFNRCCYG